MRSLKETQEKTFSTEVFDWRIQPKKSSFSTGSASRNSQSKKIESKKPFFDCVRKPYLGFSRKRPFSTDKSDCIRNGLIKKIEIRFGKFLVNLGLCLLIFFFS